MRRLFGYAKEEPPKAPTPTLTEAKDKIDLQVKNLEAKIIKADEEIRELVAKGGTNPTAKARALQAMKKKKLYEQNRDQLLGTQFNVENLAFQQEQAEITAMAVEAMKAGHDGLKAQADKINIASVDKLTDEMADLQDEMKAISEALAQNTGVDGVEQSELDEEYAKMQEEMAAAAMAGASLSAASKPAEVPAAAASTASPMTVEAQPLPSAPP
eukprot:TRINITY_DN66588_c0_g1_i1.p1 TRINITY_DN66588_c0_g1~~TRINITY_DN66588_c0_g1_i1.p1  ORF type:complete len:214 (-),score=76.71 TRINITY_DN66588_c0_g1_i1:53-694(-)